MTVRLPLFLRRDELPPLPAGWSALTTEELSVQLPVGRRFEQKTCGPQGRVPVIDQSESDTIGFHDDPPGIDASPDRPVVTFANHTCAMRVMRRPFSVIQNVFPKIGRPKVCDTLFFYYSTNGRVRLSDYKGHHPLFRSALIPTPPLATQRKIASVLSAYDNLIENNLRRIRILGEMAQALYREWFVEFRFPGHERVRFVDSPLGRIPEGWEVAALGALANVRAGNGLTKKSYSETGWPAYSASGPDGLLEEPDHDESGVVISAVGAQCGKTWLALGKWSCISNTLNFAPSDDRVSAEYLFLATKDPDSWNKRGSAQPFIAISDVRARRLIASDVTTGRKFAAIAVPTFDLIRLRGEENALLRRTRDLLLPRLISGELDVSNLDIAVPGSGGVRALKGEVRSPRNVRDERQRPRTGSPTDSGAA